MTTKEAVKWRDEQNKQTVFIEDCLSVDIYITRELYILGILETDYWGMNNIGSIEYLGINEVEIREEIWYYCLRTLLRRCCL